jgi:hypothetical protein
MQSAWRATVPMVSTSGGSQLSALMYPGQGAVSQFLYRKKVIFTVLTYPRFKNLHSQPKQFRRRAHPLRALNTVSAMTHFTPGTALVAPEVGAIHGCEWAAV